MTQVSLIKAYNQSVTSIPYKCKSMKVILNYMSTIAVELFKYYQILKYSKHKLNNFPDNLKTIHLDIRV